jgi:hypothetical protein
MGWYINYELELEEHVDWDDGKIGRALKNISCDWLYLRDSVDPIIVLSLYSQHDIQETIKIISDFYDVEIRYRLYGKLEWINLIKT